MQTRECSEYRPVEQSPVAMELFSCRHQSVRNTVLSNKLQQRSHGAVFMQTPECSEYRPPEQSPVAMELFSCRHKSVQNTVFSNKLH